MLVKCSTTEPLTLLWTDVLDAQSSSYGYIGKLCEQKTEVKEAKQCFISVYTFHSLCSLCLDSIYTSFVFLHFAFYVIFELGVHCDIYKSSYTMS
jgi:hypothetical protein